MGAFEHFIQTAKEQIPAEVYSAPRIGKRGPGLIRQCQRFQSPGCEANGREIPGRVRGPRPTMATRRECDSEQWHSGMEQAEQRTKQKQRAATQKLKSKSYAMTILRTCSTR